MERRRIAAAAVIVVLLLTSAAVFRIVDPFPSQPTGPELDLSEPPEEIAYDALIQLEYRDYTVEVSAADALVNESDSLKLRTRYLEKFDNSDRQYRVWDMPERRPMKYVNPYFAWEKGPTRSYRGGSRPGLVLGQFHREDLLLTCDCVDVAAENESVLVLSIQNTSVLRKVPKGLSIGGGLESASLRLVIDKRSETLREIRKRAISKDYEDPNVTNVHLTVYRYSDWGTTEVERPSWAPITVEELVKDVQNVERENWFGS